MFYHTVLAAKLYAEVESSAILKPLQGPISMGTVSVFPSMRQRARTVGFLVSKLLGFCLFSITVDAAAENCKGGRAEGRSQWS